MAAVSGTGAILPREGIVSVTAPEPGLQAVGPASWIPPHRTTPDEVRTALADEPLGRVDLLTARVGQETGGSDTELSAGCRDLQGVAAAVAQRALPQRCTVDMSA